MRANKRSVRGTDQDHFVEPTVRWSVPHTRYQPQPLRVRGTDQLIGEVAQTVLVSATHATYPARRSCRTCSSMARSLARSG
jgi:hypothetical protein